jgi:hypothetical protein
MAHQDERLRGDVQGDEIARLRDLAGVADIDPGARPQALHLELEHLRVDVDVAVHPVGLNQRLQRYRIVAISFHAGIVESLK